VTPDTRPDRTDRPCWQRATPYRVAVSEMTQARPGWLSHEDLESARERLPLVYVDAFPVRVDERGLVVSVGLLLRAMPDGSISRAPVSGRVLYGERVRDALLRHLEKDLGPMALPRVPPAPQPFTIAEYFPDPLVSGYVDPRQHAVSLAYVVPVTGDCSPSTDALDLVWMTPDEAASDAVALEMTGGQDRLLRLALAHVGVLP
jgi:ADP-ribose pyrophosphatase YjhB (NUDIX family)